MTATTTTALWKLRIVAAMCCAVVPACGEHPLPAAADVQFDGTCGEDVNLRQWQGHAAVLLGTLQAVAPHAVSAACPPETQVVAGMVQILVEEEVSGRHPELVGSIQQVVFPPGSFAFGNPMLRAGPDGALVWERIGDGPGEPLQLGQVLGVGVAPLDGSRWLGRSLFTVNAGLAFQTGNLCTSGMVASLQGASVAAFADSLRGAARDDVDGGLLAPDEADERLRGQCIGR